MSYDVDCQKVKQQNGYFMQSCSAVTFCTVCVFLHYIGVSVQLVSSTCIRELHGELHDVDSVKVPQDGTAYVSAIPMGM